MIAHRVKEIYWEIPWDINDKDFGGFDKFYSHDWKVLVQLINQSCKEQEIEMPQFSISLKTAYISQLQKISLRTLIFEMHTSELCGELYGGDEKGKYDDYSTRFLCDACYVREVYLLYPELYKEVIRFIADTANALLEAICRFEEDKQEINDRILTSNKCNRLLRIDGGDSDSHNGGRKVYILELDNGERLVYKPRNMKIDVVYGQFVQWVSNNIDVPYRWNKVIDKKEYGWSEWVEQKPCNSHEELERYYLRNGILICVSYLLGSEDIHYENLIAHGEYPIIIDLEMGIGSRGYVFPESDLTETERIYRESVLQTGLLPLYTWNEHGEGVNVSAISGGGGQLVPFSMPKIVQAGTVRMHIEYVQPEMGEGKNLATVQGDFIEPAVFLEAIKDGFRKAYRFLCDNKSMVQEWLNKFKKTQVRYLFRDTQQYSMIMSLSYAPKYLEKDVGRKGILEKIKIDNVEVHSDFEEWRHMQEIKQLSEGDIPYFWYDPFERSLIGGTEAVFENFFSTSIMSCLRKRLAKMGEHDMNRQIRFIHAAISIGTKKQESKKLSFNVQDIEAFDDIEIEEVKIQVAESIADQLLENAIWSEDKKEVGWISIMMAGYKERSYLMSPMNLYLYDGLAGVALFIASLYKATCNHKYLEVEEVICNLLFSYTDKIYENMRDDLPTGAFSGEGSIAYTYALLYLLIQDKRYLSYLEKQCLVLKRCVDKDKTYDVLSGNAGAILVFLYAYEVTKNQMYLIWAKKAGEVLSEQAVQYDWGKGWVNPVSGVALTGYAHGSAGIMWAFLKLGYYSGSEKFYNIAQEALLYEDHFFDENMQDWKDLRNHENQKQSAYVWCHGRGGIIAARSLSAKYIAEPSVKQLLVKRVGVDSIYKEGRDRSSLCLCHGLLGTEALLREMGVIIDNKFKNAIITKIHNSNQRLYEILNIQEAENYGLISGLAGIGYSCLYEDRDIIKLLYLETNV